MKNAFAIVTLSALLSGCAALTPVGPAPAADAPPAPSGAAEVPRAELAVPDVEEALPKAALTSDLFYNLMKAELDFKDGKWQGPYMSLMGAAQQTRDPRLARRAAEMALAAKQPDESIAAIRLWRALAPESEEAAQYYLGFAVLADKLDEAEQILQRRLKDASPATRGLAIFQGQQILARAKNKVAAAAALERLMTPYTGTVEAQIVLAQVAFARSDAALAMQHAQAALALAPASELAVLTLAQVTPDQNAVATLLAKFLAANPNAREVRGAHARMLVDQKAYAPARDEFMVLLKTQPDNLATLYALGIMSMQLGELGAAETHFKRFIEVLAEHPSDERDPAKVLMMLAQLADERDDILGALAWLAKIDSADPAAILAAQLKHAQLLGKQGDLAGARARLAALTTQEPREQVQIVLTLAQILRDAGQAELAFSELETANKRFPANPDLLYDYALLAEKTGHLDVMETALRSVIAQSPDNQHAYNALGYSLAERNIRLPEALALLETAMKMAPDDPFIMDSMGWVQFRLGHLKEAEALLRRAYGLRSDPEIAVHLGEVLWQGGRRDDAQKLWREARKKDPKNDALKSTLARLNASI